MPTQLTDATLVANNSPVGVLPNSIAFTEGFGEQKVRVMSVGGGKVEQVASDDAEAKLSDLKFSLIPTPENIKLAREWKANSNQNVFQIAGSTRDGERVTRTFTQAQVTNNYEVGIGTDANIDLEIQSNAAI